MLVYICARSTVHSFIVFYCVVLCCIVFYDVSSIVFIQLYYTKRLFLSDTAMGRCVDAQLKGDSNYVAAIHT